MGKLTSVAVPVQNYQKGNFNLALMWCKYMCWKVKTVDCEVKLDKNGKPRQIQKTVPSSGASMKDLASFLTLCWFPELIT